MERNITRFNHDGSVNTSFGAGVTGENADDTLHKARVLVNGMVRASKRYKGTEYELWRKNFKIGKPYDRIIDPPTSNSLRSEPLLVPSGGEQHEADPIAVAPCIDC